MNSGVDRIVRRIKSLFLAANPVDTERLSLDREFREISSKIRASEYRDSIELISVWAVRPDDLIQSLNEYRPQIVHFSGHGSSIGEIVLVDELGNVKPISPKALKTLFATLKDNIRVVILNACYSRIQSEAITEVIDCAIGMNTAITDDAAIIFIASFYRALGFGRSVQESFNQGKIAMLLAGLPEENTPELLVKPGVDANKIILINGRETDENVKSKRSEETSTGQAKNKFSTNEPEIIILMRVRSGSQLITILSGVDCYRFEYDDPANIHEAKILQSFCNNAQDLGDLMDGYSAGDRIELGFQLNDTIQELETNGFYLFGTQSKQFVMNSSERMQVALFKIARKSECQEEAQKFEEIWNALIQEQKN